MKLFGENYLRGKVYFASEAGEGTVFTIELPTKAT
jgi:chemotaxis protein histidine kinase CheA